MVLTETPGTALDKVSMDIVKSLPITENRHSYIFTYQYSAAVPLKQVMSSEIAETLVEKFINPYIAPKAWIIDQEFHKQRDASYRT